MTISKDGIRQLLREYFEDYNTESRFIYDFGGEQFLIQESINRSEGVSKHVIITLFDEYMDSYNIRENFIYDMQNCHFLIGLQTASFKELSDSQMVMSSDSAKGFKKPISKEKLDNCMSKTEHIFDRHNSDNPNELMYCDLHNKYCEHADIANNHEIGFTICNGEYCDIELKKPFKLGFGEDELLS